MHIQLLLPWIPSVNHYWGQAGKRKFIGKKGKEFRIAVAEAAADAAPGQGSSKSKKRKKQAGSRQQDEGQPHAGSQEQQMIGAGDAEAEEVEFQLPSGKRRRKSRKADSPAASPTAGEGANADGGLHFAAGGSGVGDGEDATDMRWRDNNKRRNVKSGPFSKTEKETLRQAGGRWARL